MTRKLPAPWPIVPPPNYGRRRRFGPYYRQAVRFVGRAMERVGAALDSWSWGWRR